MSKHLPEQVRKQSEKVQALYDEMGLGEDGEGKLPGEDPITPEEPGKGKDPAAAAAKPDEATPPAEEERTEAGKSGEEDWEHKYKTLQGMHNTEMQKLRDANQDLSSKIGNLEKLIADMSSAAPEPASVEVQVGSVVTEEDLENYGASIDVMRRVSKEEMAPVMQQLSAIRALVTKMTTEVLPKVDNLANSHARTATDRFWAEVEQALPNWAEINNNADFETWLLQSDPASGMVRQDLLADAQKKGDAKRVIHFFKSWIAETGYGASNSETNTAHADASSELESQIAPGTTRTMSPPADPGAKPPVTREFIQNFYLDVSKGKFKGRDSERAKIEADIFEAQNEGRVV